MHRGQALNPIDNPVDFPCIPPLEGQHFGVLSILLVLHDSLQFREAVKEFVKMYLDRHNLRLLGVIPYDKSLAYPLLHTVRRVVAGTIIANGHKLHNKVANIIDSSLVEIEEYTNYDHLLLVISSRKLAEAIRKIKVFEQENELEKSPLSGIIITNHNYVDEESQAYININEIPVMHTHLDTYGAVIKISKIEVKSHFL